MVEVTLQLPNSNFSNQFIYIERACPDDNRYSVSQNHLQFHTHLVKSLIAPGNISRRAPGAPTLLVRPNYTVHNAPCANYLEGSDDAISELKMATKCPEVAAKRLSPVAPTAASTCMGEHAIQRFMKP